jgi:hypothetical protein
MIHIDWMIGSDKIDIDGLDASGARTPAVFRRAGGLHRSFRPLFKFANPRYDYGLR